MKRDDSPRSGEMPWVSLERRVYKIEQSLKLSNIEGWKEMKLNFEKLDKAVEDVKAKLASIESGSADDAENQAKLDAAAQALKDAVGDVGGSVSGISRDEGSA